MRDSEKVLIELSKQAKNKEYQFERLYRILCNPDMYTRAYSNIYSNNGSATCGVNSETADGFSENKINQIIESLKNESYQAKPVRRTYIPKKNGKTRPLGIPNFSDRLIQEVCRMILEAIYEPVFSDNSLGFRPNKSCHTALKQIKNTFINSLPNKYEEKLVRGWENSSELSIGQWQRIAIARANMRNGKVVIFDEPSASLDAKTESRILNDIVSKKKDKIGIIITHRFLNIKKVDEIIVLKDGVIEAQGKHEELLTSSKVYYELYNSQKELL